jgi:hypothetical protein
MNETTKSWFSYTMTSTNYLKIVGSYVYYGVESQDDEQAFRSSCLVAEFLNSEADWWAKVNLRQEQVKEIYEVIAELNISCGSQQ